MTAPVRLAGRARIVTVFGSSRPKEGDAEYDIARTVGRSLAAAGFSVCNGGYAGTMEASARGAREAGGKTIGVVTEYFSRTPNRAIDRTIVTKTLLGRLKKLMDLGEAYVVLQGSTGTLLELAAVWEHMNKRIMRRKPIVAVGGFWVPVIETLRGELIHEGKEDVTGYVSRIDEPERCGETVRQLLGEA